MMKRTTIFFLLFSSFSVFGQSAKSFEKFLQLFPETKIDSLNQVTFLKRDYYPHFETLFAEKVLSKSDDFTALIIRTECFAGGTCGSKSIYTFDNSGQLIANTIISKSKSDCSFENSVQPVLISPDIITLKVRNSNYDCDSDKLTFEEILVSTIRISKTGEIATPIKQRIDLRRSFHTLSYELVPENELRNESKDNLAIMRNELFAARGYQFSSQKWKSYFGQFEWYNPTSKTILESDLNEIERRNLELIKQLEKK